MGNPVKKAARAAAGVATGGLSEAAIRGTRAITPDVPNIQPPPVVQPSEATQQPATSSRRVQQAATQRAQQAASRSRAGGRRSTIATGPRGLIQPAETTRKTLLGV